MFCFRDISNAIVGLSIVKPTAGPLVGNENISDFFENEIVKMYDIGTENHWGVNLHTPTP